MNAAPTMQPRAGVGAGLGAGLVCHTECAEIEAEQRSRCWIVCEPDDGKGGVIRYAASLGAAPATIDDAGWKQTIDGQRIYTDGGHRVFAAGQWHTVGRVNVIPYEAGVSQAAATIPLLQRKAAGLGANENCVYYCYENEQKQRSICYPVCQSFGSRPVTRAFAGVSAVGAATLFPVPVWGRPTQQPRWVLLIGTPPPGQTVNLTPGQQQLVNALAAQPYTAQLPCIGSPCEPSVAGTVWRQLTWWDGTVYGMAAYANAASGYAVYVWTAGVPGPVQLRPYPVRPFPLAGAPTGLGDAGAGFWGNGPCSSDGGDNSEPILDPRVYAAVQWQLSQYTCPRCGPTCGCGMFADPAVARAAVLAGPRSPTMNQMTVPGFLRVPARRGRLGALGAAGPDVYAALSAAQQAWVQQVLAAWLASSATQAWYNVNSGSCPGVSASMDLTNAQQRGDLVACFQAFYNAQANGSLPTDGTLDSNTLSALIAANGAGGGAPCPGNCVAPAAPAATSYTAYYVVGGIAVAALIGGIWYAMRDKQPHHALPAGAHR